MQGTGYLNRAKDFEDVRAYASTGNDEAHLNDSSKVDTLEADRTWVKLYGNNGTKLSYYVIGFDKVYAYSSDVEPVKNVQQIGENLVRDMLILTGTW